MVAAEVGAEASEQEGAKRANTFKLYAIICAAMHLQSMQVNVMVCCRTPKPRCLWVLGAFWSPALEARSNMQQKIQFAF